MGKQIQGKGSGRGRASVSASIRSTPGPNTGSIPAIDSKVPFEQRQTAIHLLERIDGLLPQVKGRVEEAPGLQELIDQRSSLQHDPDPTDEFVRLCREIERRYEPFRKVDEEIRAAVAALKEFVVKLPVSRPELRAIREDIEKVPLLAAVESRLPLKMQNSLHDFERIRARLHELLGDHQERLTPADVIEVLRKQAGLTIEALALESGVDRKQIYAIKNRKNTTVQTIRAVATTLNCDPGDLI